MRKNQRFGWVPDLPDRRDHIMSLNRLKLTQIPDQVDLRNQFPPCYDQGELGSCTANAIAGVLEFEMNRQKETDVKTPSRLFIYYNERVIEGTVMSDSGAMIRDGIKSVASQGAPPEPLWPYDISQFICKPPNSAYNEATKHEALQYSRMDGSSSTCMAVLAAGFPFAFGFTVYDNFESREFADAGYVLGMPTDAMGILGGHAVVCVGYDLPKRHFLVRNSWSPKWGLNGYFWMPFDYLCNPELADDLWQINLVT